MLIVNVATDFQATDMLIRSIGKIAPVVVVDTLGNYKNCRVEVVTPSCVWSEPECWNWVARNYNSDLIVIKAGVVLSKRSAEVLLSCGEDAEVVSASHPDVLGAFLVRPSVFQRVGYFDSLLGTPDFEHRLGLSRVKIHHVPGGIASCLPSSHAQNLAFLRKWGCLPSDLSQAKREPFLRDGFTDYFSGRCLRDTKSGKRVQLLNDGSVGAGASPVRRYWVAYDGLLTFFGDVEVTQVFRWVLGELSFEDIILEETEGV